MSDSLTDSLGHRQRLRERFAKTGLAGFADYEVVELLLTLAIPRGELAAFCFNIRAYSGK
jgi:DNA repair protein RadC